MPDLKTGELAVYPNSVLPNAYKTPDAKGIAHFAEHMFFKGTKKRKNARVISEELDGVGLQVDQRLLGRVDGRVRQRLHDLGELTLVRRDNGFDRQQQRTRSAGREPARDDAGCDQPALRARRAGPLQVAGRAGCSRCRRGARRVPGPPFRAHQAQEIGEGTQDEIRSAMGGKTGR